MRGLTLVLLALFAANASAGSMCGVPPTGIFQSRFEPGEVAPPAYVPNPVLPSDATPLALSVTFPTDGITVGTAFIQVHGTFAGPPNTGVSVNGTAALQAGTNFLGRGVLLEPGTNTLTVEVTSPSGVVQSVTRTVNFNASVAPDVELKSAHSGDYAPFSLRFTTPVRAGATNTTIERVRIDYDGNATFDLDTTNSATRLTHRYQNPGLYVATAEVTLNDGDALTPPVVVTASHRVMSEDLDVTRASLCKTFETFRARLAALQYTSALDVFNAEVRPRYQGFIEGLGANGGVVATGIGEIATGNIGQEGAELLLARPISGQPGKFHSFPLQFTRDSDGVWRISAL